jgi:hypothetical protein
MVRRATATSNGLWLQTTRGPLQSPEIEDLGASAPVTVADGGTLLFRLAYAPKGKVWVVVVKPTIIIQAEEDALKEEALRKDGKK